MIKLKEVLHPVPSSQALNYDSHPDGLVSSPGDVSPHSGFLCMLVVPWSSEVSGSGEIPHQSRGAAGWLLPGAPKELHTGPAHHPGQQALQMPGSSHWATM